MAPPRTTEAEVVRLYRGLLRLYPAELRDEYGRELCLVFKDRCREESSRQTWQDRFFTVLFVGFAALALLLAAVGLYATLSYTVSLLTRLLKTQLYETSPLDPATYFTAPTVLLLVALLAAFLPTRRATRVDPIIALRHE